MGGTGMGLSGFPRATRHREWRAAKYAAAALVLAAGGLIAASAPSEAAPIAPSRGAVAGPAPMPVVDYCGHGYHRENKQRTKWGSWVGKCVPNKPKKTQPPAGQAPGQPASPPQNQPPKQPG